MEELKLEEDNPKVEFTILHAYDLLRLLEQILSDDDNAIESTYRNFAKSLAYKLYAHCITLLKLVEREEHYVPFAGKSYMDLASVRTLVRVSIETYLTLFEVFFEFSMDNDTADFRLRIWALKGTAPGLLLKERIPYLLDEEAITKYSRQFDEHRQHNEEFKQSIRETNYFRNLKQKQRDSIERLLRNPKDYFSIKYSDRSREQLLSDAGLNKHILTHIYSSTSSFIHSDGYSAWESNPFNDYAGIRYEGFFLFVPIALIGRSITHFASISEHYRHICEEHPQTFKLANNLSEELKKGKSDYASSTLQV